MKDNFDQELEDLLVGINKIQESADKNISVIKDGIISTERYHNVSSEKNITKLNFSESVRQKMRPEASVWLGIAALVSTSNNQQEKNIKLANRLGGHLARRRARPLGEEFGAYKEITISPRVRNFCVSLIEVGCEIQDVFGMWIQFNCPLEKEEIKSLARCIWPAINFVEKSSGNFVLIPRFPERMPIRIADHPLLGKVAIISESGEVSFVFWMDEGFLNFKLLCGIAWTNKGIFPVVNEINQEF